jgi:predicted GIY-YIG superfamily endonuclease
MQPTVYVLASGRNGTLHTGVTANLPRRAWQHREGGIGACVHAMAANDLFGRHFIPS